MSAPRAQRRHANESGGQAIVQVVAQTVRAAQGRQGAIGRCEKAHVDGFVLDLHAHSGRAHR